MQRRHLLQMTGAARRWVHIKKIAELFDSGATIVNIHSGQPDQERVLEFYAAKVLPRVRQHYRT